MEHKIPAESAPNAHNVTKSEKCELRKSSTAREGILQKRREIPHLWRVLGKARPVFDVQMDPSNAVKLGCIRRFLHISYANEEQFWIDFMAQVDVLLDSRRFCRECKQLGYEPETVAEHVVFLGSAPMRKVLREGIQNSIGQSVKCYADSFVPELAKSYMVFQDDKLE